MALSEELSRECQIEIVRKYVQGNYISAGMCADWVLHDIGDDNPHAHIMLTMRGIKPDGSWAAKEKKTYGTQTVFWNCRRSCSRRTRSTA